MKKVKILHDCRVQVDPTIVASFRKDRVVSFPDHVAEQAVEDGKAKYIEEAKKPAKAKEAKTTPNLSLEEAIKKLDPKDQAHVTKSGKPNLNYLKELTGGTVDKDAAYKLWDELHKPETDTGGEGNDDQNDDE